MTEERKILIVPTPITHGDILPHWPVDEDGHSLGDDWCHGGSVSTRDEFIEALPLEQVAGYLSAIEWIPARVHPVSMLSALREAFDAFLGREEISDQEAK